MADTFTGFLTGGTAGHSNQAWTRQPYLVESVVDFAEQNAAAADVYRMIQIPAETLVLHAGLEVLTTVTSGGSATFDVEQTGGTANQWVAAHGTLTAGYASLVDSASTAPDLLVTTADTIDLLVNDNTATAGKVRVWAVLLDISGVNEDWTGSDATTTA